MYIYCIANSSLYRKQRLAQCSLVGKIIALMLVLYITSASQVEKTKEGNGYRCQEVPNISTS